MGGMTLTDTQSRTEFFQQTILDNLRYWLKWIEPRVADNTALDQERHSILRAISFAFGFDEAQLLGYRLIIDYSPYMERRGYWEIWNRVLTQAPWKLPNKIRT